MRPLVSPQQAVLVEPSSNVMKIRPFRLYAGDAMMIGTQMLRKASMLINPPGSPLAQGASCPSLQRFGARKEKLGVVLAKDRSLSRGWNDSTWASQYAWSPVTD